MPDIDPSQLRALAAVIDEGSFDQAAAVLHVTPSAVSQRIKSLETSAGQILVRRTKPSEITEAGRHYLRLSRQISILLGDARSDTSAAPVTVPIAINGDSLTTWALPALASLADRVSFDVRREDQDHSSALLRAGTVMAAITSEATPVQGCSVARLGVMRYRAMASPAFAERWFSGGVSAASMSLAPVVVYDREDDLQDRYMRARFRRPLAPPRHHIPGSADFARAMELGFGWGMIPDLQSAHAEASGALIDIDPGHTVDVPLHLQMWTLDTPILTSIADAIRAAAREALA